MAKGIITYYDDVEQGTPEWHALRDGMYTGSNAHKLLGVFGATSYAQALAEESGGSFYTERGHVLETQAIELYGRRHGLKVHTTGLVKNSLFTQCIYSPDGLDDIGAFVLEIKAFNKKNHLELMRAKDQYELPLKITAQVHYGMLITGRRKAKLMPFNPYFAKKKVEDESGLLVDNPDYNPALAYKEIIITYDAGIARNFTRILTAIRS